MFSNMFKKLTLPLTTLSVVLASIFSLSGCGNKFDVSTLPNISYNGSLVDYGDDSTFIKKDPSISYSSNTFNYNDNGLFFNVNLGHTYRFGILEEKKDVGGKEVYKTRMKATQHILYTLEQKNHFLDLIDAANGSLAEQVAYIYPMTQDMPIFYPTNEVGELLDYKFDTDEEFNPKPYKYGTPLHYDELASAFMPIANGTYYLISVYFDITGIEIKDDDFKLDFVEAFSYNICEEPYQFIGYPS
ncbi:MAG: hypothetical protein LBM76_00905 [Mycoplasmataceae bacterium]|jgi:hypothetical protein|nr:hypothetical protein [Mycoplasmataceae bacterium]